MGLRDYEEFSTTEISEGKTRLQNLLDTATYDSKNHFIYFYMKDCLKASLGEAVNRHCFKFSRLRDEIYFINCYLVNPNETNKNVSDENNILNKIHYFNFVVNDKSFWNRFTIYLKSDPNVPLTKNKNITCLDVLKMITNSDIVDRCTINLLPYEIEKIDDIINKTVGLSNKQILLNYNIVDGALCKIINYRNYNKRIWYELLTQPIVDPHSEGGSGIIYSNFGSYKDEHSEMFYNPKDVNYKDISFLYL